MLNIGNNCFLKVEEIVAIAPPESAPVKRTVAEIKKDCLCLDFTYGKRTRSIIFLKSGACVLSSVTTNTLHNALK